LHPNGTVRMVFIASVGGGNVCPLTVRSLDAAGIDFVSTCGLTPERPAILRAQLERNNVFCVQVTLDDTVAPMFCRT
jgi:hypothetical protein